MPTPQLLATTLAFFGLLLASYAQADQQPVQPHVHFQLRSGTPEMTARWFTTPEEAFAEYKAFIEIYGAPTTVDNFTPCSAADSGGQANSVVTLNGVRTTYCHTHHYNDGSTPSVRTSSVLLHYICPKEKPRLELRATQISSQELSFAAWCSGSSQPPQDCDDECGNPIQIRTQTKIERESDIRINDLLRFERTYSSYSGEWRHNFSTRGWNLSRNQLATLASNSAPAKFVGTFDGPTGLFRASVPYMSNEDLGRAGANDWLISRVDGGSDGFVSSSGLSHPGRNDKARVVRNAMNQYSGLIVARQEGLIEEFDVAGRLLSRRGLDGRGVVLTYLGPTGAKVPASAPTCTGVTVGPMTAGSPSCVTDIISGRQLVLSYNGNTLVSVTDPSGASVQYTYDGPSAGPGTPGYQSMTGVSYPDSANKTYHYNESSLTANVHRPTALTGVSDETNTRLSYFSYDSDGRAISTARSGGVGTYTIIGAQLTDPLGAVRTLFSTSHVTYASDNTIANSIVLNGGDSKSDAGGSGSAYRFISYDANANVQTRTDYRGMVTSYTYDLARNLETSRVEAQGTALARTITSAWHPDWRLMIQQSRPKQMTWWVYNGQVDPATGNVLTCAPPSALIDGKPIAVICKRVEHETSDLDGSAGLSAALIGAPRVWGYTYNGHGQVLTVNGPRTDVADVTTYSYRTSDDLSAPKTFRRGDLHTITNALGHVTTYNTYNANGQPLTITDPNGVVTTLAYDLRQRLTSRTVGSEQTSFEYWPTGLLKKATLPDGTYLEYSYDAAQRLTDVNDAEGNRIHYTLDAIGNRTKEDIFDTSNALTGTRTQVFNTLNQLSQIIGAAGGASVTTAFGYDSSDNQTSIAAPLGRNTTQSYDELNRLSTVTDPESGLTQYGYDALDQLISVTDPEGLTTSYTYNGLGELRQQVSPDAGATTNTYDSGGNLKTSTDARNKAATYHYDALNRVTTVTYADQTIGYTYDTGTNQKGRLTQITDNSGSTNWSYDGRGRVLSRQQTMGAVSKSVSYSYDASGRLQTMTLPSGNAVTYGYSNGKVVSLTLNGSTTVLSNVLYQPFGPTQGWTWGNATLAVREYDTDGLVTNIDSAGLKSYEYDDAFRITDIIDRGNAALSQNYGYDFLDRLTSATGTSLNQGWTYDANGNRLTQTGDQPSTYAVSGTSNRMASVSGALTRSYTYNASGSVTGDGTATFTYDDAGRMVSATKAGVTTIYALNALGQRVRKTSAGASTYFVYDEAGHLIGEYDNTGALIQETVWFGDIPVATIRPSGTSIDLFYVHADHLTTPRRISRPSDNVIVWRWDSDPFGTGAAHQDPDGDAQAFVYGLRFPGQYLDAETGLHYNYFRDYDPSTGRYVQADPAGPFGEPNPYLYARANPLAYTDALGLICGSGWSEVVPDLWFADCCREHDRCYDGDGCVPMPPSLPPTKEECDSRFGDCVRKKCSRFGILQMRIACEGWGKNYHWAVDNFGQGPFDNARDRQRRDFGRSLNLGISSLRGMFGR